MPKFNRLGQVIAGYSEVSLDRRVLYGPGGKGWPLTDELVIANLGLSPTVWKVATLTASGAVQEVSEFGANFLAGGGGRWIGSNPGQGMFGSVAKPKAGVLGAGLDGTLAYCPDYAGGYGLVLNAPDEFEVVVPDAVVQDLQVLGPDAAMWYEGNGVIRVTGIAQPRFALTPEKARRVIYQGQIWLLYWSAQLGVILQVDGASDGYVLAPLGVLAYNRDMIVANGKLLVCWSTTQGEAPQDVVVLAPDLTLPRVRLVGRRAMPTFYFNHPVLVAPFGAVGSGQPDLFTQGIYAEAPDPSEGLRLATAAGERLLLAHDGQSDWTPPDGLRSFDVPMLECYLTEGETVEQSASRWTRQMLALLTRWPYTVGVIPMFYCQGGIAGGNPPELWPVETVLEALTFFDPIVNLSQRVRLIAPFEFDRRNGITAHQELRVAFDALVVSAHMAGLASLPPIPKPVPKPVPKPAPAPIPAPPFINSGVLMLIDPSKDLLYVAKVLPHATRKGAATLLKPNGNVYSIRGGGTVSEQPANFDGGDETCQIAGNLATFHPEDGQFYTLGFVMVDAL